MIYKLVFDMERIDSSIKEGCNTIFAQKDNLDKIEYENINNGFFIHIIDNGVKITNWTNIEFYYSSIASNLESDYLLNSSSWPLVHQRVKDTLIKNEIEGIQYLPINLIDAVNGDINNHYYVMNILNSIEAIDMNKSKYDYEEEYDAYFFEPNAVYFDEEICKDHDIFRACKSPQAIYVSDKFKSIVEREDWIGFYFYPQKTN